MQFSSATCGNCGLPVKTAGPSILFIGKGCPHCGTAFTWVSWGGLTREEKNVRAAFEAGIEAGKKEAAEKQTA